MKTFKEFKQYIGESLSQDYVLQSLADKDINAHFKDNKVVVHSDDAAEARKHLKKIGHDHLKVTVKGSHKIAEEIEDLDEELDPSQGAGEYIKDFQKSDAPQFKGKSQEKRKQMGLAAYYADKKNK